MAVGAARKPEPDIGSAKGTAAKAVAPRGWRWYQELGQVTLDSDGEIQTWQHRSQRLSWC